MDYTSHFDLVTGRNEVVAKVIFLHLSVILFTVGGGLPQCMLGYQPPRSRPPPGTRHPPGSRPPWDAPPGSRHPPWDQAPVLGADTPSGADTPPGSRLRHTVNERPVRILLECILVSKYEDIFQF